MSSKAVLVNASKLLQVDYSFFILGMWPISLSAICPPHKQLILATTGLLAGHAPLTVQGNLTRTSCRDKSVKLRTYNYAILLIASFVQAGWQRVLPGFSPGVWGACKAGTDPEFNPADGALYHGDR